MSKNSKKEEEEEEEEKPEEREEQKEQEEQEEEKFQRMSAISPQSTPKNGPSVESLLMIYVCLFSSKNPLFMIYPNFACSARRTGT